MRTFLDSVIPGVRCQNPNCQSLPAARTMTLRMLLFDGYTCNNCGWQYVGAMVKEEAKPLDKMNKPELLSLLNEMDLELGDVPTSGTRGPTNGDIRDYIISKK